MTQPVFQGPELGNSLYNAGYVSKGILQNRLKESTLNGEKMRIKVMFGKKLLN